jgi:excisionase family DNA binding protein
MKTDWYSPEQVAEQLGLHVRTVRNYVREGRLKAVRIGKQYRISRADLEALTGGAAEAARTRHVEVSSIVDVDGIDPDDAERLAALLTGLPTGPPGEGGGPRLEVVHEPGRSRLKVIVVGGVDATVELVRLIGAMVEEGT